MDKGWQRRRVNGNQRSLLSDTGATRTIVRPDVMVKTIEVKPSR